MRWAEITIDVPAESAEAVSHILLESGCDGVAEKGCNPVKITGCLPVSDLIENAIDDIEDRLIQLPHHGLSAPTDITIRFVEDEDWANAWKKHFKPIEIGARLVVKPGWETYNGDPNRVVVELDPGMAFGTGGHPTTKLCLEALEELTSEGMVVADVGTGSGILALAAAKLGASAVYATDIDLLPRKIAIENVGRNNLSEQVFILEPIDFDALARDCDLVVANIIALTIIELLPTMTARIKPGGLFIGSGIVDTRLAEVLSAMDANGLELVETRSEDLWQLVVGRKRDVQLLGGFELRQQFHKHVVGEQQSLSG